LHTLLTVFIAKKNRWRGVFAASKANNNLHAMSPEPPDASLGEVKGKPGASVTL